MKSLTNAKIMTILVLFWTIVAVKLANFKPVFHTFRFDWFVSIKCTLCEDMFIWKSLQLSIKACVCVKLIGFLLWTEQLKQHRIKLLFFIYE